MESGGREDDLLRRFRALDSDAWEAVYRRSFPKLFEYARRRLPAGYDPDDAVSECFARAVDRIGHFADQGLRVEAWLFGILRYVVLEQIRRSRRQERERPDGSRVAFVEPSPSPGPLEQALNNEESDTVRSAFAQLSVDDQELLWLRLVGELSVAEVAAVVEKQPTAVRKAHSRALFRLRDLMKEVEA